jgi:hypothetical protein
LLTFKWAAGVLNIQVIYILNLHALFCAIYLDDANLVGDSEHFVDQVGIECKGGQLATLLKFWRKQCDQFSL